MSVEQELIEAAMEALADGRPRDAGELFGTAVEQLANDRERMGASGERLLLELQARAGVRMSSIDLVPEDFADRSREEVALWDLAIEQIGKADVVESYGGSLVSIGLRALQADDLSLALDMRERMSDLFATDLPPVLEPEWVSAAAL